MRFQVCARMPCKGEGVQAMYMGSTKGHHTKTQMDANQRKTQRKTYKRASRQKSKRPKAKSKNQNQASANELPPPPRRAAPRSIVCLGPSIATHTQQGGHNPSDIQPFPLVASLVRLCGVDLGIEASTGSILGRPHGLDEAGGQPDLTEEGGERLVESTGRPSTPRRAERRLVVCMGVSSNISTRSEERGR